MDRSAGVRLLFNHLPCVCVGSVSTRAREYLIQTVKRGFIQCQIKTFQGSFELLQCTRTNDWGCHCRIGSYPGKGNSILRLPKITAKCGEVFELRVMFSIRSAMPPLRVPSSFCKALRPSKPPSSGLHGITPSPSSFAAGNTSSSGRRQFRLYLCCSDTRPRKWRFSLRSEQGRSAKRQNCLNRHIRFCLGILHAQMRPTTRPT